MGNEPPVLFLGVFPKRNKVLDALQAAEKLLDSVAFVQKEGDTRKPLKLLRAAIKEVKRSN